jgi:hypothetical protein
VTLVLDDPADVDRAAAGLRQQAGVYEDVATLLRGLRTDDWTGSAAESFRCRFDGEPSRWFDAAETLLEAAGALGAHADVVRWAQRRMTEAHDLRNRAALIPSPDAAVRLAEQADAVALDALSAYDDSSWRTSARLDAAAVAAPRTPRWHERPWWDLAWRMLANEGVDDVNTLSSLGAAIGHHPGDAAALIGGLALLGGGTDITVASVAADVTGIGAAVGLPAGAAGIGLATAGVALAGASAGDLWMHATTDDAQTVLSEVSLPAEADGAAPPLRWANPRTLADHFVRHGTDFGFASADEYAIAASELLERGRVGDLPTKIGTDGTIRVFDPETNTFGSFTPSGMTRTFYKPTSPSYWARQSGDLQ